MLSPVITPPGLITGERMNVDEFLRRWENLPDLKNAELTLQRAAAHQPVDPRVRQNLALVIGLQGRFPEAEEIARADLPPEQAAANVAYLRQMLARKGDVPLTSHAARSGHGAS